jgi:hypothetical protein
MSPELFDSEAQVHRRTEKSDCYALGMVIYEVLSRREPFYRYAGPVVIGKVAKGERPERPQGLDGAAFTDGIWKLLGLCWAPLPQDRPSVQDALKCLEEAASSWTPPPPPSMVVPSEVNSPTSDTSVIAREESEDADEVEVSLPSQPSDEFPVPTAVSPAADSPTLDTFVIAREESEDADEGEAPLLSQPSDRFPVPTAVSSAADSPTSDTFVIASEESEDVDEGEVPPPSQPSDKVSVSTSVS